MTTTQRNPMDTLRAFMGAGQRHAVICGMASEERQFFVEKMSELAALVAAMPVTYQQDSDDPIATLHYFVGSADWYITEKDIDADGAGQVQAFGLADLFGDGGELGYISISEIISCGAELDFHFKPRPLSMVRGNR